MGKDKDTKKPKKMKTGGQTGVAPESCATSNGNNNMKNNNMNDSKG